jgi:hypothetical protein
MKPNESPADYAKRADAHAETLSKRTPATDDEPRTDASDAALSPKQRAAKAQEHAATLTRKDARTAPAPTPRTDVRVSRTDGGHPIDHSRIERT